MFVIIVSSFWFSSAFLVLTREINFPEQYTLKALHIESLHISTLVLSVFVWMTVKAGPDKIIKKFHSVI